MGPGTQAGRLPPYRVARCLSQHLGWPTSDRGHLFLDMLGDNWGLPCDSAVKNLPVVQEPPETQVPSLDGEDPLEEGMATHSSILA